MATPGRDVGVVLVAAGSSSRMGGARPKVWLELGGAPILARALATIAAWPRLASLAVVVRAEDVAEAETVVAAAAKPASPLVRVVVGGAERADSVRAGLAALAAAARIVLVHDAARPLASLALYERVATAAEESGAAAPALALVDTLKRRDDAGRLTGVARDGLHALQTPQGFKRELLERAHANAPRGAAITDDATVVEATGARVVLVEGEPWNVKITVPANLAFAQQLLAGRAAPAERRVGLGHDLHRLAAGGPLRLGGVDLAGNVHAVGHSDGDALLHAVTDAVLGACALGDIGQLFPDSDRAHLGRDSAEFLEEALALARAKGFRPVQVDVVVRLERPKLAPEHVRLRERLAALLGLPLDAVSIKAKTAEGIGEIGEGRAVACEALIQMERVAG